MEQIRSNLKYSLIAIFIITGTMALDFMTLHDIFNDYLIKPRHPISHNDFNPVIFDIGSFE